MIGDILVDFFGKNTNTRKSVVPSSGYGKIIIHHLAKNKRVIMKGKNVYLKNVG